MVRSECSGREQAIHAMFAASHVQQPEDSIGFLLWRVAHRHQREVDRVLAPLDLTHLQFVVIIQTAWLSRDGESVTQRGLAQSSNIHPMQLSNILKALEAKGLISRGRCPATPRAKQLTLTDPAIKLLTIALPRVKAMQDRFFDDDPDFSADLHARLRHVVAGWGDGD